MSEAKPTRRLSSFLKSKRTERVVELIVVPLLLIISLLLPPASVGTRLLNLDLPSIKPDEPSEIMGPAGARLNVPEGAVAKRVRVRFDSVGAAELGAMSADSPEMVAAQQVPMDLLAFEPFYRFEVKGDGPSQASLTLPIPYELAALDLADLYAWDGSGWKWVPSQISDDGLDLVAELDGLDSLYLIVQTQPQTPRVGFVAGPEQVADVPPSASVVSLQGATLAGDGTVANLLPAVDIADANVLMHVSNMVDGVLRSDWLDNLIIDPALVEQHVATLSGQTGFDGVELDYRGADPALKAEFTALVRALGDALHAQGKTLAVVLDPPAVGSHDTGAYDWRALGEIADLVRIRAYGDPQAWAADGPMDDLLKFATSQIDRHKLDLALSADSLVRAGDQMRPISYQQALTLLASELDVDDPDRLLLPGESITVKLASLQDADVNFDPEAQVYSFRAAGEDGTEQTVFLTNAASIARRTQYVNRYALGGTSIEGALAPEADRAIATLLDDLPHTVVPPTPRFAYVYTIWNADGDAIGSQVVPVDDPSMTWTAPNNPGRYVIRAEISDDGGETTLGTVGLVDVSIPTPTFTPTPTNTPTPTPTNTPSPTNTPRPTAQPQQATQAQAAPVVSAGSVGGYFGYGIQAHMLDIGDLGTVIGHINGMGFNWVKQQVEWWRFNPAPGQYNWGSLDQVVDAASNNGINVLLSVVAAPAWARPGGDDRSVAGPPADPATYATFMRELASRYKGRVKAYEIWNEQNLWYEWGGRGNRLSAAAYVDLLHHAYNAVKSVDPGAVVVSGALTPTGWNDGDTAIDDRTYLEQMYQAGVARYCDAIGAHPSGYNNPPDADWQTYNDPAKPGCKGHPSWFFRGTMESYRNIMVKYGDGGKRIWPTEFGWATTENLGVGPNAGYEYAGTNSEAEQAAYLVRAFQMGRNWGWVGPMFVWNLNFAPVSGVHDEKAKFSIVRADWSPRPAYAALRDMGK